MQMFLPHTIPDFLLSLSNEKKKKNQGVCSFLNRTPIEELHRGGSLFSPATAQLGSQGSKSQQRYLFHGRSSPSSLIGTNISPSREPYLRVLALSSKKKVHNTRSVKKIKVDTGSSSSDTGKTDYLGLRQSAQEIRLRTSNSKLLEKQLPPTPCTQMKSGRPQKLNSPSPLKTPDRGKRHILSRSSVSKLSEEELNLSATKMTGNKEKSVKQVTMESKEISCPSDNQNISMKRSRMDARSFRSLFKHQRRRAVPAIDEDSQKQNKFPKFSSDSKLVVDKVNGGSDCIREVAEEPSEDHAAQADEVDSLSSSEGFNTGNLHTDGGAELSHSNHIHSLANESIAALPEADILKASINGCIISESLAETEDLPERCSTATENIPDLDRVGVEAPAILGSAERQCTGQSNGANIDPQVDNHKNDCAVSKQGGKSLLEASKFLEYWLPVQVSNLQLEQYCNTLLSNINALCSYSKKSDPVGVLNDVLLTVRKCCAHPYILDPSMQPFNKGLSPAEILEFGIKACGKLHLLDKMLSEMKSRHLTAVIFFQSIGPVDALGNILDDFLRQRFGENSYERVETGLNTSKRQAALNRFKAKESGQFVLLLENRISNTSIKLPSVDGVIICDSDSNPRNDLRLLQKLSFVSQSKPIRVFRLYSCYTVEEQALLITKQNPNVDNIQSLNKNVKNTLMWGASYLFSRLDEFHASDSQASALDTSYGQSLLNDVVKEFCAIISQNSELDDMRNSVISKVLQSSGPCITDVPLFGEQEVKYTCGEEPQVFWKKLLEGRNPRWRHISGPTPRNRKRVQYFEGSPCTSEIGNDETGKKRRKTVNSSVDAISTLPVSEGSQLAALKEGASTIKAGNQSLPTSTACQNGAHTGDHAFNSSCSLSNEVNVEPVERVALPDEQKSLHIYLKAEMAKVFEVLKLSDDVKHMVGRFLDFIMENHRVSREPATLLQALEISLCRVAASILKQKFDENKMLMLAKEYLNFECTEDEATNVYLKLRSFKKTFLQYLERNEITSNPSIPGTGGPLKGKENVKTGSPKDKKFTNENVVAQQTTVLEDKLVESVMEKMVKKVQSKCDMRMSRLKEKQQQEIEKFQKECEEKRVAIERHYGVQFSIVRFVHRETPLAKDNLKNLNNQFARELEELKSHKDLKMKEIEEKHKKEMNEEMQNTAFWVSKAKVCCTEDAVTNLHLYESDSTDDVGYLQDSVDAGNNTSDSRDDTGDQDIAVVYNNSNKSDSRKDIGNLQDIEDVNRKISDCRNGVRNLQDISNVNNNPMNVASRNDIGNLEDNVDVNNNNNYNNSNPANVASEDDIGHVQDNAGVNDPPGVASVSGCHLEENEPSNILNESERIMAPSSVPTTTTDEVQSKDVLSTTVSEKPMATISPAEASVSSLDQPNEVGNIGDNCEEPIMAPSSVPTTTTDEVQSKDVLSTTVSEKPMVTISPAEALVSSLNQPNEGGNISDNCEDNVPVVPLTSEKHTIDESSLGEHANGFSIDVHECAHTEDVIHNHPSEVHGIAHDGVVRHEHPAEAIITTEELMVENCSPANNDGNQNDVANESIDGNTTSQEQLLVALPGVHTGTCSDVDGQLLQTQDQVLQDQCSPPLASNELQINQGQLSESEAGSPRVDDARQVTQSNCESLLIGNSEPQQPPSGGSELPPGEADESPNNHESNGLRCSETSSQLAEVETAAEPLCNADSLGRVSSELHVSVDLPNVAIDRSPTDLSVSRTDCQPSGELHSSSQNTQTMPHEVRITSGLPNQANLQPSNLTPIQGPNDMQMHHTPFMSSMNSPMRLLVNPLAKEFERIRKDMEQAVKSHEDWRLQQKSDCDKEIIEMIAQIRNKYDAKIQEGDKAFLLRKNELEGNQNRVLMNKILADAFRSKCVDPRPLLPQMQQAPPSNHMQQYLQHATMLPPLRPQSIPGFSLTGQPVQQTPRGCHPVPMSRFIPTPTISPTTPSPVSQPPHYSTQPFIRTAGPVRPPLINDISPSGNQRLAGDVRAPAPHLHPFRPASVSASSPSPLPSANMPSSSMSFPRVPPQQQTPSPSLSRVPPQQQTPSPSLSWVLPQQQSHLPSLPRAQAAPQPTPTTANNSEPNNRVLPTTEIGTTFDSIDLFDFGTAATSAAEPNAVADVVCLSDDD